MSSSKLSYKLEKINYITDKEFPPGPLTSDTDTILSGYSYGNGTYTLSTSETTSFSGFGVSSAFNKGTNNNTFTVNNVVYHDTGIYSGDKFTISDGTQYYGHWFQLYYDSGFCARSMSITNYTSTYGFKDFILVGSNDETTWNTLLNKNNVTLWVLNETKTFTFFNEIQYKFYRIIVNKTNGGQLLVVKEIIFYGYDNTMYLNTFVGIGTNTPISKFTILNSYPNDSNGGFCLDARDVSNTYNLKMFLAS